jgi:hypothetical protein
VEYFRIAGTAFSVRATEHAFLHSLSEYIGEHRTGSPDLGERYYPYSVDCGQSRVLPGGRTTRRVGTAYLYTVKLHRSRSFDELIGRIVSSIREVTSLRRDDFIRLRAGAVVMDGGVTLLPSGYQPQLPALVGSLVRGGLPYVADELVHLDPVLRVASGIELPLLIDAGDLRLFPEVHREVAATRRAEHNGDLRFAVSVRELGGRLGQALPIRRIVFPRFEPGSPTRLEPISRSEATFGLAQAGLNLHVWGERALVLADEIVRAALVQRLHVGSLAEATELLLSSPVEG